jgi:hypothetical protein
VWSLLKIKHNETLYPFFMKRGMGVGGCGGGVGWGGVGVGVVMNMVAATLRQVTSQ